MEGFNRDIHAEPVLLLGASKSLVAWHKLTLAGEWFLKMCRHFDGGHRRRKLNIPRTPKALLSA